MAVLWQEEGWTKGTAQGILVRVRAAKRGVKGGFGIRKPFHFMGTVGGELQVDGEWWSGCTAGVWE